MRGESRKSWHRHQPCRRRNKKGKREGLYTLSLMRAPFLTVPTFVVLKNFNTASLSLSFASKSLLGCAFDCENRSPSSSPVLCFGLPLCHCPLIVLLSLSISFFHVGHSLKRCSLLCLPPSHHQHWSVASTPTPP